MGDTISNLTPRVVINQSTAPTGSDNQLKNIIWIDSSSGDTAKTYNASKSSWETIGGKPDSITISKNSNGQLEVINPSETVIGDFEQDTGDWFINDQSGTVNFSSSSTNQAFRGSSYALAETNDGYIDIRLQNIDLSNADKIQIPVYGEVFDGSSDIDIALYDSSGNYLTDDTGSTTFTAYSNTGVWEIVEFEISSVNVTDAQIQMDTSSGSSAESTFRVDGVKKISKNVRVSNRAGN